MVQICKMTADKVDDPDKRKNERIVDEIDFKFPVYYDGKEGRAIRLFNETTVEAVCFLGRRKETA